MVVNPKSKKLKKEVRTGYMEYTKSNRKTTEQAIALGHLLNELKIEVKKNKMSWIEYAKEEFPHIHCKKRERFMRIAKHVDQNYPSALHLLGQTTLILLCKLCGDDDIGTYLEKKDIDLQFRPNNKSVKNFQEKVGQLLDRLDGKKDSSLSSVPTKLFYRWLDKLEKQLINSQINLTKNRLNILKKINTRLSRIISNYTEE